MGDKIATRDGEVYTVLINDRFELNMLLEDGQIVDYENLHLHEEAEGDDVDEARMMVKRPIGGLADENGIVKKKARAKHGEPRTREAATGERDDGKERGKKTSKKKVVKKAAPEILAIGNPPDSVNIEEADHILNIDESDKGTVDHHINIDKTSKCTQTACDNEGHYMVMDAVLKKLSDIEMKLDFALDQVKMTPLSENAAPPNSIPYDFPHDPLSHSDSLAPYQPLETSPAKLETLAPCQQPHTPPAQTGSLAPYQQQHTPPAQTGSLAPYQQQHTPPAQTDSLAPYQQQHTPPAQTDSLAPYQQQHTPPAQTDSLAPYQQQHTPPAQTDSLSQYQPPHTPLLPKRTVSPHTNNNTPLLPKVTVFYPSSHDRPFLPKLKALYPSSNHRPHQPLVILRSLPVLLQFQQLDKCSDLYTPDLPQTETLPRTSCSASARNMN